jgi:hypothetical protein
LDRQLNAAFQLTSQEKEEVIVPLVVAHIAQVVHTELAEHIAPVEHIELAVVDMEVVRIQD